MEPMLPFWILVAPTVVLVVDWLSMPRSPSEGDRRR